MTIFHISLSISVDFKVYESEGQKWSEYKHNLMNRIGLFVVQLAMKPNLDSITVLPAELKIWI